MKKMLFALATGGLMGDPDVFSCLSGERVLGVGLFFLPFAGKWERALRRFWAGGDGVVWPQVERLGPQASFVRRYKIRCEA